MHVSYFKEIHGQPPFGKTRRYLCTFPVDRDGTMGPCGVAEESTSPRAEFCKDHQKAAAARRQARSNAKRKGAGA